MVAPPCRADARHHGPIETVGRYATSAVFLPALDRPEAPRGLGEGTGVRGVGRREGGREGRGWRVVGGAVFDAAA